MNISSNIASVTMGQLQSKLDTISHNVANSETTGFKKRDVSFSDLLSQQYNNQPTEGNRLTPPGLRVGSGAKIAQTRLSNEPGIAMQTGRTLDFALTNGYHFFQVERNDNGASETRLTREGAFFLTENPTNDQELVIANENGFYLLDDNGERMTVPYTFESLQMTANGQLEAQLQDGTVAVVGQMALVEVAKPQLLEAAGHTDFLMPQGDNRTQILAGSDQWIQQGALEGSNVDMAKEMSDLILTQRQYQFNARSLSMADEMSGIINGIRR
ncbi:flagellar hook-basal body protein [Alkalicoccobacillus murimartini]|uniref:Flagellar basal-body rod protein FlgG n=1 Tax=Alkalicoccobacillus murimartini TaxID=171685 RepID=A0ABT9YGQ0_9BACI|nr:flagellar hook-basal body protein [Alkalicoccobacillus murimartini]MDQ0207017.1 flagellar basal-body rod protein FlgG [Alkalicoccobacillus murimartini]